VTVCVAAIYDGGIIGASDRMLTAGDIEFEPNQTKILDLTNSITLLLAGDSALQMDILYRVRSDVRKRITDEPTNWWTVKEVAELYVHYYNDERRKRSANAFLAPLGLDHDSFIGRQQELAPELVTQLATELINFELPEVSTIFSGTDLLGSHIYVANGADITCHDAVGFAAIGAGYWHADSQLMFGSHNKYRPFAESLMLVYSAKKRAEVAPGVGEATDMFVIDGLGGHTPVGYHVLGELEKIYQTAQEEEKKIAEQAEKKAVQYVKEILTAATPKEQAILPEDTTGSASSDQKELSDGSEKSEQEDKPKPN
jgi:hypothetical protein